MRTNYTWEGNNWRVIPEVRISYQREFLKPEHYVNFISTVSNPIDLSLKGTGKDFILTGASLSLTKNQVTLECNYDYEWNPNAHTHFLSLVFGVNF